MDKFGIRVNVIVGQEEKFDSVKLGGFIIKLKREREIAPTEKV